jgi:magnesium chelatase accessory protein
MAPRAQQNSGVLTRASVEQADSVLDRRVSSAGLSWHVSEIGQGPSIFMLHGTGASVHSWDLLSPLLAEYYRVVMIDLPGHGRTSLPPRAGLTINGMSSAIGGLLDDLQIQPELVIGHSAGAAVLTQMCLDRRIQPRAIISLNGAMLPLCGSSNRLFGPMAKLLSIMPMVPTLVSRRMANPDSVARLITQLGSNIPASQIDGYVELLRSNKHISAALRMMANWDLDTFEKRLSDLQVPLELVVCENDLAVPASQADQLAERISVARVHRLPDLGHLGHEEAPRRVFELIRRLSKESGIDC